MIRKLVSVAGVCSILLICALSQAAPPAKTAPGSLVIVFKDGHRQTFSLADVERVEYPGGSMDAADLGTAKEHGAPRGRYVGKWQVGDGVGGTFTITLDENGSAFRTLGDVRGHWRYSNGDALITWDDGAQDAIRRVGSHFQKFAYSAHKSFDDTPDNVAEAHNTTPRPI